MKKLLLIILCNLALEEGYSQVFIDTSKIEEIVKENLASITSKNVVKYEINGEYNNLNSKPNTDSIRNVIFVDTSQKKLISVVYINPYDEQIIMFDYNGSKLIKAVSLINKDGSSLIDGTFYYNESESNSNFQHSSMEKNRFNILNKSKKYLAILK